MADTDIRQTTTSSLGTSIDYKVGAKVLDSAQSGEIYWYNPYWSKYLGYYKQIPELKKAVDALAMWTVGKGWTADARTTVTLNRMRGWGEDSFQSILWSLIVTKKINGDAYCEIIRNEKGTLINLKPLNPSNIRIVVNEKGLIVRYDEILPSQAYRPIQPEDMLHLCNDRIANEIHGTSVVEACQWVIDARNEAMADKRRTMHRSTIRIIEVDMDNVANLSQLKSDYKEAIQKGEVLFIPKGTSAVPDVPNLSTAEHLEWIRYLEQFFYSSVGVSKAILGGSEEFTEAGSKIGYLSFEQPYMTEQRELETDLWNQLAVRITFERPVSLKDEILESEAGNTGQTGFQPTETQAGRNE